MQSAAAFDALAGLEPRRTPKPRKKERARIALSHHVTTRYIAALNWQSKFAEIGNKAKQLALLNEKAMMCLLLVER